MQPDAANFNSWRRHIRLLGEPPEEIVFAWEDVKVGRECQSIMQDMGDPPLGATRSFKAMFNGGTRKRVAAAAAAAGIAVPGHNAHSRPHLPPPAQCLRTTTKLILKNLEFHYSQIPSGTLYKLS